MMKSIGNPPSGVIEREKMSGIDAQPREAPMLTNGRKAARNAAGMVVIIAAMFLVFYGINMQRMPPTASTAAISPSESGSPASVTTTPAGAPETTGQR